MDLLPRQLYHNDTWAQEFKSVSGFYGPGVVISWFLTSMSMLYDANHIFKTRPDGTKPDGTRPDGFHYLKYASVIFSSFWALGDTILRALHTDFGPSYAAALYMSDKGFELATLIYTLQLFPIDRRAQEQAPEQTPTRPSDVELAERRPNTHS